MTNCKSEFRLCLFCVWCILLFVSNFFSSSSASKSRSRGNIQALQYENVLYSLNGMPIADKIILLTLFIPCIKNVIYYCKSNTIHLSSFCASHLTADFSPDRNQRSGTVGVAEGGGLSGYHDTKIYTYKRLWGKKCLLTC